DGTLNADGAWKGGGTQLNFKLDVSDAGRMLERLGYADAVKRGTARLEGKVSWNGAPTQIDYATLDGSLSVEAARGQFNKLEPGVGRLLGILSLQSLPRRITLDFRDIFSEGFAYDSITGNAIVARGTMTTQDLQIQGPSAKIFMKGDVSIPAETQNLRVRVEPAVGESVAVGTMLANPVVGAAAWVVQKVLKDPLGQIFAFEYAVTGSWSDPKVEKIQQPAGKKSEE
ncbi:MAG: TIGR02099 family protein, partial [Rhodocyclaceae bacterium]|nr:TIGR02099 family protein [Rhodocyclaceae bacterium]